MSIENFNFAKVKEITIFYCLLFFVLMSFLQWIKIWKGLIYLYFMRKQIWKNQLLYLVKVYFFVKLKYKFLLFSLSWKLIKSTQSLCAIFNFFVNLKSIKETPSKHIARFLIPKDWIFSSEIQKINDRKYFLATLSVFRKYFKPKLENN